MRQLVWKIIAIQLGCVAVRGVCGEVLRRGRGCPVPGRVGSAAAAPQPRAGPGTGNVVKDKRGVRGD